MGQDTLPSLLTCGVCIAAGVATGYLLSRQILNTSTIPETRTLNPLLIQAIHFSAQKHQNQKRKNAKQTPYICHPISVAHRLSQVGITDHSTLIAAILHDTVEDTDTTLDEIETSFGLTIAKLVDEVTDDKTLPKSMRKQLQIDHAPHISYNAKLVKLADKLDNLSDLMIYPPVGWSAQRVEEYFAWAERVIEGLRGTNTKLEKQLDHVLAERHVAIDLAKKVNSDMATHV